MIYYFALFMTLIAAQQGQDQPGPCKMEGDKVVDTNQQCILQGQKSCGPGRMTIHSYQTAECKPEQVMPFTICANTQGFPCQMLKGTEMFKKDTNFEDFGKCFKWSLNQFNNIVTCMDAEDNQGGGGGDPDTCKLEGGKNMHKDPENSCKLPAGQKDCGENFITSVIFPDDSCQKPHAAYCAYFPPGFECGMIEKEFPGGFGQCTMQQNELGDKFFMKSMCKASNNEIDCKSQVAQQCKTCVQKCAKCIGQQSEECQQCEACAQCIPYVKCHMNNKGCGEMDKKACRKAKDKCKWSGKKASCADKKQKKVKCKKLGEDTCDQNDACQSKMKKGKFVGCKNKKK